MKRMSKSRLFLFELLMNILFFCVCSAVCLAMFARAHTLGEESARLNRAVVAAQSAAEAWKAAGGDLSPLPEVLGGGAVEGGQLRVSLNEGWEPSNVTEAYCLTVSPEDSGTDGLKQAVVRVQDASGAEIYALTVRKAGP